jgi:hypothetical protein
MTLKYIEILLHRWAIPSFSLSLKHTETQILNDLNPLGEIRRYIITFSESMPVLSIFTRPQKISKKERKKQGKLHSMCPR